MRATLAEMTKTFIGIVPADRAAGTVNGTGRDREVDACNDLLVLLHIGAMGAAETLDVKIQESATVGGTYTDVPSGAFPQKVTATDPNTLSELRIDLDSADRLRFMRAVGVTAGANTVVYSVELIFGRLRTQP